MTFNEYQEKAKDTALDFKDELLNLAYYSMGIAGESGELIDKLKKIIRDDKGVVSPEKRQLIILEMGDVLWYLSQVAKKLDIKFDDVAKENLTKIASRKIRNVLRGDGDER